MLIDTHCHLADPAYDADRAEVLERAWAAGVARIVVIGESPDGRRARPRAGGGRAPARRDGRHPPPRRRELERGRARRLAARARSRRPRGGRGRGDGPRLPLRSFAPRPRSARAFEAQLALAREAGKPAVIHAREADDDVAAMLARAPGRAGHPALVQQRPGLLRAGLDLRHYVSFSGMVTFKNWRLDQAILETPARPAAAGDRRSLSRRRCPTAGKRNEPAFVRQVAERIAAVRGMPVEELIAATGAERGAGLSACRHPLEPP